MVGMGVKELYDQKQLTIEMDPNSIPDINLFKHSVPAQLRFNDIDILGHLNNTVYFSFYDTGKAYFFDSIMEGGIEWRTVETVIANVDCAYLHPIFFGEEIEVLTRCKEIHEKSFVLQQLMVEKVSGAIKSACETVMVSFDPHRQVSEPIPERWRKALEESMR